MRKIHLISTPHTLNGALETWFYQNEMLGGIPFTLDMEAGKIFDSVVVFIELADSINLNAIRALHANRNKVVYFDMGDELGKKNVTPYVECDLVLRNYLYLNIFQDARYRDKVIWIPNGFRTGVGPRNPDLLKPVAERQWLATFLGWLDNARSHNNERQIFKGIAPRCGTNLFWNASSNWAGGYNLGLYSAIMESSIFAPCPAGNCPDSIRIYDAMELGCIPVYLRHTFLDNEYSMQSPPFPILNSWDELPDFLERKRQELVRNPRAFEELQKATIAWWTQTKRRIAGNIQKRLLELRLS
jgi:hypothetical protein